MHFLKFPVVTIGILSMLVRGVASAVNLGHATQYVTGLGSCGAWSQNTDFVVALSDAEGYHCWQHIKVYYQGKTIDVTVVDTCPGCPRSNVDLSLAAFQALAPLEAGLIPVAWEYA